MFDFFRYGLIVILLAETLFVGGCAGSPGVEAPAFDKTNTFDAGGPSATASNNRAAAAGTTGSANTEASTDTRQQTKADQDAGHNTADAQ